MARKTKYGAMRLRMKTLETLRGLKKAYEECYGIPLTYDAFVCKLMDSVEAGDPAVWDAFCRRDMERDIAAGRLELD